jgi:hypothetical protein
MNGDLKFLARVRAGLAKQKNTMTQTEVNTQHFQPS